MRNFWNWVRNEDGTRTLTIDGVIAEESWFDDDVTPKLFREQLNAGNGDIRIYDEKARESAEIKATMQDEENDTKSLLQKKWNKKRSDDVGGDIDS